MIKILLAVLLLCLLFPAAGLASSEEKLVLKDGAGKDISAVLFLPEGQEPPYRTVICSHGFGGTMDFGSKAYAAFFAKNGYAAVAFNFRPDGVMDMAESSVLTETATLCSVIDQITDREEIDKDHVFLFGESQGGFDSTHAFMSRDYIRGLVLLYPAFVLQYNSWKLHPEISGGEPFDPVFFDPSKLNLDLITTEKDTMGWFTFSRFYTQDSLRFNIYEDMRQIQVPTLIIHGTADQVVPIQYSRDAADPAKGFPNARLLEIAGAGHGFSGNAWQQAADETLAFLNGIQ
jgi:hypothetical protein